MNVAHIHTNREWGGGEYQILELLKRLPASGVRAVLYADAAGPLAAAARQHVMTLEPLVSARALAESLAERGVDLIHVHDSGGLTLGVRVGRRSGIPLVLTRRIASPLRQNFFSRRKYSAQHLAAVIAISETVKTVFLASGYPDNQMFVVPSGLDFDDIDRVTPNREFRRGAAFLVAGIGKLSEGKNWGMLVETAARVRDAGRDVCWVIAGDGPEHAALMRQIRQLGLAEVVTLAGFRQDALAIMKGADLLFFPSRREGASVTVRQAMAAGVPVVAVNAAGTAESLAGHGWLVTPEDLDSAAQTVMQVLDSPNERQSMAQAALISARKRFAIEQTLSGTCDVYRWVLSKTAG